MSKKNIILFILLIAALVFFIVLTLFFITDINAPSVIESSMSTPEPQVKNVYYIANSLSQAEEYAYTTDLRHKFMKNANIEFYILNSEGLTTTQVSNIKAAQEHADLIIVNPLLGDDISKSIQESSVPILVLDVQDATGTTVYFSDKRSAQLMIQYISATLYYDSNICIVTNTLTDSLYLQMLNRVNSTSQKYNRLHVLASYPTHNLPISDIKTKMPRLLEAQSVLILDELNAQLIVDYLVANNYEGSIEMVSSNPKMISYIQADNLDALVFKNPQIYADSILAASLSMLQSNNISSTECYQHLINIYNLNEYLN
ncbi:MAG: substrate-binding domain-containing protein [Christensenellaceae bacterium]